MLVNSSVLCVSVDDMPVRDFVVLLIFASFVPFFTPTALSSFSLSQVVNIE